MDAINTNSSNKTPSKPSLATATQIEKDCPDRLRQISDEIKARLAKADKQTQEANDHLIAVNQLLIEAKGLCDVGGFKKFRELFCPHLGKSQAYARLAIAAGKKTVEAHRAVNAKRNKQFRAKQKEKAATSAKFHHVMETAPVAGRLNGNGTSNQSAEASAEARKAAYEADEAPEDLDRIPAILDRRETAEADSDSLETFDLAVGMLLPLVTMPDGTFAATAHSAEDLRQ
jgi:hypothetical protein